GSVVVTDRFTGSSLAYQGVARGLGVDAVAALSRLATSGLEPDVTVLLRVESVAGIACHTGRRRCFFNLLETGPQGRRWVATDPVLASGDARADG
ncbi:MAG: hypothetical protein ACXWG6_11255, partial [Usitatibacter sp.]